MVRFGEIECYYKYKYSYKTINGDLTGKSLKVTCSHCLLLNVLLARYSTQHGHYSCTYLGKSTQWFSIIWTGSISWHTTWYLLNCTFVLVPGLFLVLVCCLLLFAMYILALSAEGFSYNGELLVVFCIIFCWRRHMWGITRTKYLDQPIWLVSFCCW